MATSFGFEFTSLELARLADMARKTRDQHAPNASGAFASLEDATAYKDWEALAQKLSVAPAVKFGKSEK